MHRHRDDIFESLVIIFASAALVIFLGTQAGRLPVSWAPASLYLLIAAIVSAIASLRAMSLMWFLESFTSFGHILSHGRLMAFGLAAAALALAANDLGPELVRQFGGAGFVGAVLAGLAAGIFQILFFLFTIIGHIIQPARLHWVEFLMKLKYHDETGREYQPFQRAGGEE